MENISQNSDIEIRTMKSDIEAIKAGGGDISLAPNQSNQEIQSESLLNQEVQSENKQFSFKTIIFFVIIILAVAGIGFLAYYLALKLL